MIDISQTIAPKSDQLNADDLIGGPEPAKKGASIEDVLLRVRKSINNAKSLDDLERRLEIIRGFPTSDFRDLHRDLVAADVQRVFEAIQDGINLLVRDYQRRLNTNYARIVERAGDQHSTLKESRSDGITDIIIDKMLPD